MEPEQRLKVLRGLLARLRGEAPEALAPSALEPQPKPAPEVAPVAPVALRAPAGGDPRERRLAVLRGLLGRLGST